MGSIVYQEYQDGVQAAQEDFAFDSKNGTMLTDEEIERFSTDCKNIVWCSGYVISYLAERAVWTLKQGKKHGAESPGLTDTHGTADTR